MNLFERNAGKKTRGQTMVEFALVLPILLVTMYGIMEFGRLLFIYVTTTSASREAARYASGTELVNRNGIWIERFRDCAGIREAAQRVGILAGIDEILIRYDSGPGTTLSANCTGDTWPDQRILNDRVVVTVRGNFRTIVPIVPLDDQIIRSETARTIIRDVEVDVDFQPPPAMEDPQIPPYVSFTQYSRWISESQGDVDFVIRLQDVEVDEDGVPTGNLIPYVVKSQDLEIKFTISGEVDEYDYQLRGNSNIVDNGDEEYSIFVPVGSSSVTGIIYIVDDLRYEYLERIVLHIQPNDYARRIHPYAHVIYIQDNDSPPTVTFEEQTSEIVEPVDTAVPSSIPVILTGTVTSVEASVGISVSGTAEHGVDYSIGTNDYLTYNSESGQYRLYFTGDPVTGDPVTERNIEVTPLSDGDLEGPETIIFTLTNPLNATLDGALNPHTVFLLDRQCNIYGTDPVLSGNQIFYWNLVNDGSLAASLSQITASYTSSANTRFTNIELDGSIIWSGSINQNPFTVSSSSTGWGGDSTLLSGVSKLLELGFQDPVITEIQSVSISFNNGCPSLSITNVLPPP